MPFCLKFEAKIVESLFLLLVSIFGIGRLLIICGDWCARRSRTFKFELTVANLCAFSVRGSRINVRGSEKKSNFDSLVFNRLERTSNVNR